MTNLEKKSYRYEVLAWVEKRLLSWIVASQEQETHFREQAAEEEKNKTQNTYYADQAIIAHEKIDIMEAIRKDLEKL